MFVYSPADGNVWSRRVGYRARTCFPMTRLGRDVPAEIQEIREALEEILAARDIELIDAHSRITGRDILLKIFDKIVSVR